jgi:hypothetical protein
MEDFMMKRLLPIPLALLLLPLLAGNALGVGFGTPTMDGLVDGVYGAAEATDGTGDGNGNAVMDLVSLYVCNDNSFWYFLFTVNANVQTTNWGKYLLYIDTTNDANGATSDAWGRNVVVSNPHKPEFSLNSWMDNAPYGPEDSQFWIWNQGTTSWSMSGSLDGAARNASTVSGIEWKIAKSRIGDPATIWVEVYSTGGGSSDNAQDTSNDPAEDWNATNWSTQAVLLNSTQVARSSGGDTTPPTLVSAVIGDNDPGKVLVTFSEPVDPATAQTTTNYTITGVNVTNAALQTDSSKVLLTLNQNLAFGSCITVRATNVKDRNNNVIVNNGTTNVYVFYLTNLLVRAHMNLYLRTNSAAPAPDSVGIEGGLAPLTWDPTCDDLLADPDGDSVFEGFYTFQHTCTGGLPDSTRLEYKFTHQCVTWESISNHIYDLMGLSARDTLEIWWNNLAPTDFTDKAIDVVFFAGHWTDPWNADNDSIGLNGSQVPLNWDVPPVTRLKDDGVLPDSTADDGIFSTRITFPAGSLKNVSFKYLWKALPDTVFNYECFEQANRNVYLNDTLFSTTNPIVMDIAYWDYCDFLAGMEEGSIPAPERLALLHNVPNPFNPNTAIEFTLPGGAFVDLSIYDVSGRLVRGLFQGELAAGSYTGDRAIRWDGTDDAGKGVRSGVYFYRLKAGAEERTRKMVLVR